MVKSSQNASNKYLVLIFYTKDCEDHYKKLISLELIESFEVVFHTILLVTEKRVRL